MPGVFRCPGGSINGYDGAFYQEMLSEMIRRGFVPFDWNISSEDDQPTMYWYGDIYRQVPYGEEENG